jgi:hypothetical protein
MEGLCARAAHRDNCGGQSNPVANPIEEFHLRICNIQPLAVE